MMLPMKNDLTASSATMARGTFPLAARELLLRWGLPGLFAVLISFTVRYHSWSPMTTLPYVTGAQLFISCMVFLAAWLQGRRLSIPSDVALILAALLVSIAISTIGSAQPVASLMRLQFYGSVVLLAVAVYLLHRDTQHIPLTAYCIAIASVHVPFLVEAVIWISQGEPPFFELSPRIANFVNVRQFGEFGFLAAVSASAMVVLSRRLAVASFALACCALFGIVAMGSRGALLSWAVFMVLLVWLAPRPLRTALHGFAAVFVTSAAVWYLNSSGLLETPNVFVRFEDQGFDRGLDYFGSGRLQVWGGTLQAIAASPLFGAGPDGYWLSGCCGRTLLQPHNVVLQLLLDIGLVGCSILLLLIGCAVRRLGPTRARVERVLASPTRVVLAGLLGSYLAYGLIDGLFYHPLPLMHFALFSGLMAASLSRHQSFANAIPKRL